MKNFLSIFDYKGKPLNIVSKYKIWFSIPLALIIIGIIAFIIFAIVGGSFGSGFNLGIDFTGGTILTVEIGDQALNDNYIVNRDKITEIIEGKGLNVGYTQQSPDGAQSAIVVKYQGDVSEEEMETINEEINDAIQALYPDIYETNEQFITYEYIGATTSSDLIGKAFLSILIAGIAILIYIIFRFEVFSGVTAVIALLHDVIIIMVFVTLARIQLNSNFIAVIITIIAYSINNTIVIFDRVRENLAATPVNNHMTYGMIVDKSVTETLGRSVNTTITTMMTITVLAIIGVPVIRDFSLMIIVGLIAGTFSSICVAPTLYSLIRDKRYRIQNDNQYQAKAKKA